MGSTPTVRTLFLSEICSSNKNQYWFLFAICFIVMPKIKNILQSVRIEEYVFSLLILMFISVYFVFYAQSDWLSSFGYGLDIIGWGVKYFIFAFVFIYLYIFVRFFLLTSRGLIAFFENKDSLKNFSLKKASLDMLSRIKDFLIDSLLFIRPFVLAIVFFGLALLLLGTFATEFRGRLADDLLMKWDKSITGFHISLWPYYQNSFLGCLTPLLIKAYAVLGAVMGISILVFLLRRNRELLTQYVLAIALAVILAFPIWASIPANSPRYLNVLYQPQYMGIDFENKDESISELTKDYQLDARILDYYDEMGIQTDGVMPISTIPSMHVVWGIIIVYYLSKFRRWTLFFSLPWLVFSTWGAVYLGQHYFVDVLVSLPVALLAVCLANGLVALEKRYYQESKLDLREKRFKRQIQDDLKLVYLRKKILAKIPHL